MQNIPVLIFGQSVRFFAQSAARAGYTVWAADCFGDRDTLAAVDRWCRLPALHSLTSVALKALLQQLSRNEPCLLMATSGIEFLYPVLDILPETMSWCGHSSQTIQFIKTPRRFFKLLQQLAIRYPDTYFSPPDHNDNLLVKSAAGFGGTHIQPLRKQAYSAQYYFQQRLQGQSGSALFLADGHTAQLLSINRQYTAPVNDMPYRLGSIETPWHMTPQQIQYLRTAINKICHSTGLFGLNSLDFILADSRLYVLEINPRPSASAELLAPEYNLFQQHLDACHGHLPSAGSMPATPRALHYIFAPQNSIVPDNMIWPDQCRDCPPAGTKIRKQHPVCSILLSPASQTACYQQLTTIAQSVLNNLLPA